jgi:hypothetical protein
MNDMVITAWHIEEQQEEYIMGPNYHQENCNESDCTFVLVELVFIILLVSHSCSLFA